MPRWITWTISSVAFVLIGRWVVNSAFALAGHPLDYADWFEESRNYVEMMLAAGIAWAIIHFEGPKQIGFTRPIALNVRASLQGTYVILALGMSAYATFSFVVVGFAGVNEIPTDNPVLFGIPNEPPETWHHILRSAHAGWVEEIVVVGLVFFLLKRTPWEIGGTPMWMTGWATAITIVIRLSYHTYHGLMVIPMILIGWLLVRLYRTTDSIVPLIVVHLAWDMFGLAADSTLQRSAAVVAIIVLVELVTKGASEFSALGFPRLLFWDEKWPGHYWGRWRWDKTPQPAPERANSKTKGERPAKYATTQAGHEAGSQRS
jgi:hypothetical protein